MINEKALEGNVKIKDYSHQNFQPDDEEDFEVKTIRDEKLVDTAPGLDDENEFELNMFNYGDQEDLPDSDRSLDCQTRGVSQSFCFGKDD